MILAVLLLNQFMTMKNGRKEELLNNILKYLMTSNKIISIFFLKEELSSKYFFVHIHERSIVKISSAILIDYE